MTLRVVIHAPTAEALIRGRSNVKNLLKACPDAQVKLVVNAAAVAAVVAERDEVADPYTVVCRNSLANQGLEAPAFLQVAPAAVMLLAELQQDGWNYIRA